MKKSSISKTLIVFIICMIASIWFISAYGSGINLTNSDNKNIATYNSIDELMKSTTLRIELPKFIESETNLNIESTMGKIIQINNSNFVLKVTDFVNNMADPLGLYNTSKTDKIYTVNSENTNIQFFRYRVGYEEYKNCTILNWCTNETSYGLMIEKKLSEEEALDILEINKDNLSKYIETTPDNPNKLKDTTGEYTIYIN